MTKFLDLVEKYFWGSVGLAIGLIILFAVLHFLKLNNFTGGAANWIGSHAQNW